VLLADGIIEAVGKKVKIPGDAWVIDGEGLTRRVEQGRVLVKNPA